MLPVELQNFVNSQGGNLPWELTENNKNKKNIAVFAQAVFTMSMQIETNLLPYHKQT